MSTGRSRQGGGIARAKRPAPSRPPRASSWKKDPGGRRERVLAEAASLFSRLGYAAVTTGDIARAAGVAEGSVFHYFGSKQGLLRAVGERYGEAFASAMFDGVDPVASRATVAAVVRRAFDFVAGTWPGFGLFLLSDDADGSAPVAQRANREVVTLAVASVLGAWGRAGQMRPLDAQVVAELLFGLVEAALRACYAGGAGIERKRLEEAAVDAIASILGLHGQDPPRRP